MNSEKKENFVSNGTEFFVFFCKISLARIKMVCKRKTNRKEQILCDKGVDYEK